MLEIGVGDRVEHDAGGDELGEADARQHLAALALPDHEDQQEEQAGDQRAGQSLQAEAQKALDAVARSEEHTSELQSLMRISYAVFCLKKTKKQEPSTYHENHSLHEP